MVSDEVVEASVVREETELMLEVSLPERERGGGGGGGEGERRERKEGEREGKERQIDDVHKDEVMVCDCQLHCISHHCPLQ